MDKLPDNLKSARHAAFDLLRDYNFFAPPVDLVYICDGEGIEIYEFIFENSLSNISGYFDYKNRKIYLNKNDDDLNKVFCIAYILGNYILNKNSIENYPEKYSIVMKKLGVQEYTDEISRSALCFARNLLVPKFMLDAYSELLEINDLGKIFGVSPLLIQQRISQEYEQ